MERTIDNNRQDLIDLRGQLRDANAELKKAVKAFAKANAAYRLAKAKAFLNATGTIPEKNARVDEACNDLLFQRDLTEGMKEAQMELVRSLRSEMSAAQTESNSLQTEMDYSRTMVPLEPVIEHLEKLAIRREKQAMGAVPAPTVPDFDLVKDEFIDDTTTDGEWHCKDPDCPLPEEADHRYCAPW